MAEHAEHTADTALELRISPLRRMMGGVILLALTGVLIWAGVLRAPTLHLQVLMIVCAVLSLIGVRAVWRAGLDAVVLTDEGLFDARGQVIAPRAALKSVDSGFMTFRPANGFTVVLHEAQGFGWRPGLWWRFGRRIGVGGMTPRSPARQMAARLGEMLTHAPPT